MTKRFNFCSFPLLFKIVPFYYEIDRFSSLLVPSYSCGVVSWPFIFFSLFLSFSFCLLERKFFFGGGVITLPVRHRISSRLCISFRFYTISMSFSNTVVIFDMCSFLLQDVSPNVPSRGEQKKKEKKTKRHRVVCTVIG